MTQADPLVVFICKLDQCPTCRKIQSTKVYLFHKCSFSYQLFSVMIYIY